MNLNYLKQALAEAEKGRGFCAPNPAVGAVIVKNNEILARGYHHRAGLPHAEVEAIQQLSDSACEGATLYVTLEPCCHFGKTPPCTDLIIQKKFKRVVYGYKDPFPKVFGRGAEILQQQGIECVHLQLAEVDQFYESYHYCLDTRLPYVTAKLAVSLDGKIADKNSNPIKITGKTANDYTHQCRKRSDAILTTNKTIIHDNPQLNARVLEGDFKKPIYILDSNLNFSLSAMINQTAANITLFHQHAVNTNKKEYLQKHNIRCIAINSDESGLNLPEIITKIGQDGVHDLWVESGGQSFQHLIQANLVNKALLYVSAKTLGAEAVDAFSKNNLFLQMKSIKWAALGEDVMAEIQFKT